MAVFWPAEGPLAVLEVVADLNAGREAPLACNNGGTLTLVALACLCCAALSQAVSGRAAVNRPGRVVNQPGEAA
jgi:hypothetical protein